MSEPINSRENISARDLVDKRVREFEAKKSAARREGDMRGEGVERLAGRYEQDASKLGRDAKATNPKDLQGVKKVPFSCLPIPVMAEVGVAMLEGALKYGRFNWRSMGVRASVYFDATQRHLISWWEGEDTDPDSQLSHITKAITSLMVLRDSMIQNNFEDDRPPSSSEFMNALNDRAAQLVKRASDHTTSPHHFTIKDGYNRRKSDQ